MTTIYYFSTTGNSLTTARRLARALDARLVPVTALRKRPQVCESAQVVGFVFPVYHGDMPYPVRELLAKMTFAPDSYVFAVTTWRGHAGAVAQRVDQLLRTRGQTLSLALGVPMPGNSSMNTPEVDAAYLRAQDDAVAALLPRIRARETECYATDELLPLSPVGWPNNFRGITVEDHCTGCGACVQVCPMDNIVLRDGKAHIGDLCATCLACFHWCPVKAIWMSRQEGFGRRPQYCHPEFTRADMLAQKEQEEPK